MLRVLHQVLKPGGRIGYFVIGLTEGLTDAERANVLIEGREDTDAGPGYPVLMDEAGFIDTHTTDVTEEFATTLRGWQAEWESGAEDMIDVIGDEEFNDRFSRRQSTLDAVDRGLLRRMLVIAATPS